MSPCGWLKVPRESWKLCPRTSNFGFKIMICWKPHLFLQQLTYLSIPISPLFIQSPSSSIYRAPLYIPPKDLIPQIWSSASSLLPSLSLLCPHATARLAWDTAPITLSGKVWIYEPIFNVGLEERHDTFLGVVTDIKKATTIPKWMMPWQNIMEPAVQIWKTTIPTTPFTCAMVATTLG